MGACAWDGGRPAALPNPTGAVSMRDAVRGIKLVNLPGSPANVENNTGTIVHFPTFRTFAKYSWIRAPRYDDMPMKVGLLARMLVAYASDHQRVREVVKLVLDELGVGPAALFSTLGRTAARGIETLITAEMLPVWIDQLKDNVQRGDLRIHEGEKGNPLPGLLRPGDMVSMRPLGVRWAIGYESKTARLRITSGLCPAPGTILPGTRKVREALKSQHLSIRRLSILTNRSRFCGPFTPSPPVWSALSMYLMPREYR